ncbi:hypothetical protein FA13DRAFT_1048558 [Coprinellus micaceus]|uniref:Uncharacterized protein n=1 Tax=Coprinellus micaceus TaxID=71717 RepID=A0A4Y7RMA0_COPMI|nr:hypothetical protein FA13DRAFT_1048558 [Coprinellus micaceus]
MRPETTSRLLKSEDDAMMVCGEEKGTEEHGNGRSHTVVGSSWGRPIYTDTPAVAPWSQPSPCPTPPAPSSRPSIRSSRATLPNSTTLSPQTRSRRRPARGGVPRGHHWRLLQPRQ